MKRIWRKVLAAMAVTSMLLAAGCAKKEEEQAGGEIELSESKLTIEVDEEAEIEIENYDDLKKVEIEIEDEDIAEAELDDEVITVTGISGGKTTLTVSAKDCEDVVINIKVKEPETAGSGDAPAPDSGGGESGNGNSGNAGHSGSGSAQAFAPTEENILGEYFAEIQLTPEMMAEVLAEGDETDQDLVMNAFASFDLVMQFSIEINEDHTASFGFLGSAFVDDFYNWLDVHYLEFMGAILTGSGETMTPDYEQQLLSMKDVMMESFMDEMMSSLGEDELIMDMDWSLDGNTLTFKAQGDRKECEIGPDGTFSLRFTDAELGENATVFTGDQGYFDLEFHR